MRRLLVVLVAAALAAGCAGRAARREAAAGPGLAREEVGALLDGARRLGARGDLPLAAGSARRALAGAEGSGWADLAADAHFLLGDLFWRQDLALEAGGAFLKAYEASRRARDRQRGLRALNALTNILLDLAEFERASATAAEAVMLARGLGDARAESTALNNAGEAHRLAGRYGAAMEAYAAALSLAQRAGASRDAAVILENMAATARRQGRMDEAATHYAEALALARRAADAASEVALLTALSAIRLSQRRSEDAWLLAREAADLGERENLRRHLPGAVQNEALAAWAMGDRTAARRRLGEAVRLAREVDDRRALAYAQWHLGRLNREMGDGAAARRALEEALGAFRGLHLAGEARQVEAELRAVRGEEP